MTTKPRPVDIDRSHLPGLAAVALFVVMATAFMTAEFGASYAGFPDESVVKAIGMALIGLNAEIPVESFLIALLIIAVALDAALDGSLMLAKREDQPQEAATDGGAHQATTDAPESPAGEDATANDSTGGAA